MSNAKLFPLTCLLAAAFTAACSSKGQEPVADVTVTVSIVGSGSVSTGDGSITCPGVCSTEVAPQSQLQLTAATTAGHQFIEWGGSCATAGSAPTCVLTVGDNGSTVTATFAEIQELGDSWALLDGTTMITFDRDSPEIVSSRVELTGFDPGEELVGMDFRVADNKLYGVGTLNNLYLLPHAATTPSASVTKITAISPGIVTAGVSYGVDTDPVNDVLVVASGETASTVNFATGASTTGAAMTGRSISAIAHTHSFAGTQGTVLFGLDLSGDAVTDELVLIDDRIAGSARDAGTIRVNGAATAGFDVAGSNLDAYALLNIGSATRFFRINLANGVATLIGSLELQGEVTALALPPVAPGDTVGDMLAINSQVQAAGSSLVPFNQFLTFDRASPGTILGRQAVVGLRPGEKVADADYRPADRVLYVLSDLGNLYFVDEFTGLLTLHAALVDDGSGSFNALGSSSLGAAFNPVDGQLWVVTATGQNLRVNPDDGQVTVAARLTYTNSIDPTDDEDATATAIDFSDSFAGVRATTALVIDTSEDNFAELDDDDLGTQGDGALGGDAGGLNGFDVDPVTGVAYAALTIDGSTRLHVVTQTAADFGALVSPKTIGDGLTSIVAIAIKPPMNAMVYGVSTANELVSFLASDPATVTKVAITGMSNNAQMVAIDFRPSDSVLFGVGTDNRVYTINRTTGAATLSAEMFDSPNDPSNDFTGLQAGQNDYAAAFDPRAAQGAAALRLTSADAENLRVIPATGETFTDSLAYGSVGVPPDFCDNTGAVNASAVAYSQDRVTNSSAAATIFVIASGSDGSSCLYTVDPANGELAIVGALSTSASSNTNGMAIAGGQNGLALAALDTGAANSTLVTLNLGNGTSSGDAEVVAGAALRSITIVLDPAD